MSKDDLTARASATIDASREDVWAALTDAKALKEFMFGSDVRSTWRVGDPILWKGEWEGRPYEDKGVVLAAEPGRTLRYSHFSGLSKLPDRPENYHNIEIRLSPEGKATRVSLTQDNNPTEEARAHSEKNWNGMLAALKKYLDR